MNISFWSVALFTLAIITTAEGSSIILICLLSSVFHELGHILMMIRFGKKPKSISVNLSEVSINCNSVILSKVQDVLITVAGVSVNLTIALLFFIIILFVKQSFLSDIVVCNLSLAVFNLLPVRSLDGGQLLQLALSAKLSAATCDRVINMLSLIIIVPIAVAGFYVLILSKYNYSLLFVAIYLITVILSKEMR